MVKYVRYRQQNDVFSFSMRVCFSVQTVYRMCCHALSLSCVCVRGLKLVLLDASFSPL